MPWCKGAKIIDWNEIRAEQISLPITFKGTYDEFPDLQLMYRGNVCIIKDKTYIHSGTSWEELGTTSDEPIWESPKWYPYTKTNCRNCGAALFYNGRCAYCGTEI